MKILIIQPYPTDTAPGQRFRYEQYLDFLKSNGFEILIHSFIDEKGWEIYYAKGKFLQKFISILKGFFRRFLLMFRILFSGKSINYIFIFREASPLGPPIFEWIIAKILRKKYIYDFDDAIWLPNFSESNAKIQKIKMYWKVKYSMKWAYKIAAGNEYLKNYAKNYNSNAFVIPTTIDTENHHNQMTDYDSSKIVIGWTGTHSTMQYLDQLIPILSNLETKFDFTFKIISNKKPTYNLKSLEYIDWQKETEIEDLATFNIGVMPLVDDQWAQGKCGFKALQYMSLGIPTVISPVGVNNQIVQNGRNGFLASNEAEWSRALSDLLESKELRKTIGLAGKKTIVERYSVLANREKYLELFK